MNFSKLIKNPFVLFAPFLIFAVFIVLVFKTNGANGDEPRYLMLASNLLKGYYSPPSSPVDLGNGPGYPVLLMPFMALGSPLVIMAMINAVLFYLSIVVLYKTSRIFFPFSYALGISLFWAFYVNAYQYVNVIAPEVLAIFLFTLAMLAVCKVLHGSGKQFSYKWLILAGLSIGYLALTKPIFGYVIKVLLIVVLVLWIFNRSKSEYRRVFAILLISLLTTMPYLYYTYSLTGKKFYWSSFGGENLYWMTSPFEQEYGDWHEINHLDNGCYKIVNGDTVVTDPVILSHWDNIQEFKKVAGVERDDLFKKKAIENIKSYPGKFIENCFNNISRILFNFPYSYSFQAPHNIFRLPFNGMIVLLALYSLFPTFINWKRIPFGIRFCMFLTLIYLGGSLLGSAETRMFTIVVPAFLIWIGYVLHKTVRASFKFQDISEVGKT